MKVDKEQWQMVTALVLVAVIAAGLLATTDIFTREPIAQAQREALRKALQQVLPEHVNDAQTDMVVLGEGKQQVTIYPGKDVGKTVVGLAWEAVAPDGYSGTIRILVGVRPEGSVHAIRVTFHRETPGLGDGITNNADWLGTFVGRGLKGTKWAVKKDGGDFDQFTGATITPRAVVKAVKGALEYYQANRKLIFETITAQDAKPEPVEDVKQGASSEPAPEVAAKTAIKKTPEIASKVVSGSATKPVPKVALKPVPKISPEVTQKVVSEAMPESAAKPAPKVSPDAAKKTVSEIVPESVSETVPAIAVKIRPVVKKTSSGKKVGNGGGQ